MKKAQIPQYAIASKAVAARHHFQGEVKISHLTRLVPQLADASGCLDVDLEVGKSRTGAAAVTGTIKGVLNLICQRGEHPFDWACDLKTDLRLVETDAEEKALLAEAEPYRVEDDRLPLRELVEDEILLSLPMLPKCDNPDCAG